MRNPIKKLAGQTAIYGLSSILGRFLNFLLTPLYASVFAEDQYGIITEMYAYVAFLVVFLTYGLETAYFRFTTLQEEKHKPVYSTILISLLSTTGIFILVALIFSQPIANWLQYPLHREYVVWFAIIVGLDAVSSIPLARLRAEKKAIKFAVVNIANIATNIGLNLFFLVYCKQLYQANESNWLLELVYDPEIGVGYVFISNLIASILKFLLLTPVMNLRGGIEIGLWKRLLRFSSPMLLVGLAGIVNETLDRIMIKQIVYEQNFEEMGWQQAITFAQEQNGIYGANYKLAMIISLFIQAYRYAAEPFFFKEERDKNSKETYVKVMDYFTIVSFTMFLGITMFISIFKYFIPNPVYWDGLTVVPILLLAYVCLGIYYNQSIWYKLSQKTGYGAVIAIIGALITLGINYHFIPIYGYTASAWATLVCYFTMTLISYGLGQKHYPVPYNVKKIALYALVTGVIYLISAKSEPMEMLSLPQYCYNAILILGFVGGAYLVERPQLKINKSAG